jgi:hypothetical protein
MGFKMMWQNVLRERDPYKQNSMIKDILLLKPYLSAYYEATKLIIEKPPQVVNENESKEEQEQEDDKEELNGDNNDKPEIKEEYDSNRKF